MPHQVVTIMKTSLASLPLLSVLVAALQTKELCSSINTSDSAPTKSTFLSRNFCIDHCKSGFAYAVVAGTSCWCTNHTPATTVPNSECSLACPGYALETCGGPDLLTYLVVDGALVEGTKSAAGASSTAAETETAGATKTSGVVKTSAPTTHASSSAAAADTGHLEGSVTTAPAGTSTGAGNSTTTAGGAKSTTAGGGRVDVKGSHLGGMVCLLGALALVC